MGKKRRGISFDELMSDYFPNPSQDRGDKIIITELSEKEYKKRREKERLEELEEIEKAACTGAGVLQEKNQKLGDVLNIRTLALAEQMGLEKQDIRAIAHSKGDWNRVAKAYNTKPVLVKAVKLSLEE